MIDPDQTDFVNEIIDKPAVEPFLRAEYDNEWEEQLFVDTVLVPVYLSKNISESEYNSLMSDELVNYAASFYERSRIYHSFWSDWISWYRDDVQKPYTTARAGIHLFAPIYAQELEGPLRYQISALTDLLNTYRGNHGDWSERMYDGDERRYVPSALSDCIQISRQLHGSSDNDELNQGFENLTSSLILLAQHESFAEQHEQDIDFSSVLQEHETDNHPNTGDVRNAIAHANYYLDFEEAFESDERNIVFELGDQEFSLNADGVLLYLGKQLMLSYAISTGITLALFHASLETDSDEYISILWNVLPGSVDQSLL